MYLRPPQNPTACSKCNELNLIWVCNTFSQILTNNEPCIMSNASSLLEVEKVRWIYLIYQINQEKKAYYLFESIIRPVTRYILQLPIMFENIKLVKLINFGLTERADTTFFHYVLMCRFGISTESWIFFLLILF